ncbi:hypothetical protein [Tichowtungia aerotolerans]|uniref:Uncharacterized protein n=1 Tax=Tichowtungia aerotolerans TaxID=2697043 RepID=A0A6P1MAA8_9BACT|nr:hypothetical protein [Tichowtungia aerotolerans]QHI69028.1 hypothetical protein GT409_06075 [Tichowtungia aerotolerans]
MQTICQRRFTHSLRTTRKIGLITTLVLAYASSCAFSAETGQWKFISGIDYSTGDYGDVSDTAMLYVPFGIGYAYHNWSGKIITGWLAIDGPGNLVDDGVILPGTGTDRSESGIADTWAAATYELDTIPPEFGFLDLTGKIKGSCPISGEGLPDF